MAASWTARSSTEVTPRGVLIITLGLKIGKAADDVLDEFTQHRLGYDKIGDNAVAHRPHDFDALGCAAHRVVGLVPDEHHLVGLPPDGDDRGFVQDDAATFHMHEHIDGAEVDSDLLFKHRLFSYLNSR